MKIPVAVKQVVDYGLVADLFQALPELLSELQRPAK